VKHLIHLEQVVIQPSCSCCQLHLITWLCVDLAVCLSHAGVVAAELGLAQDALGYFKREVELYSLPAKQDDVEVSLVCLQAVLRMFAATCCVLLLRLCLHVGVDGRVCPAVSHARRVGRLSRRY
jgi:hypothetical protein